jgi:hypothetical protein
VPSCKALLLPQKASQSDAYGLNLGFQTKSEREKSLKIMYETGIPLALWKRHNSEHFRSDWDNLLNCCIYKLPEYVKDLRNRANLPDDPAESIDQEAHLGHNLCLLWGDPNILPPPEAPTLLYSEVTS